MRDDGPQVIISITVRADSPQVTISITMRADGPQVTISITMRADGPQVTISITMRADGLLVTISITIRADGPSLIFPFSPEDVEELHLALANQVGPEAVVGGIGKEEHGLRDAPRYTEHMRPLQPVPKADMLQSQILRKY